MTLTVPNSSYNSWHEFTHSTLGLTPDLSKNTIFSNYYFDDLFPAFIHSSFSNEQGKEKFPSNEKLEFIGDSVLNLIVAKMLFELLPNTNEGHLAKLRGALVSEDELYRLGLAIKVEQYIFLGRGELLSFKRGEFAKAIIADCFEAILGQIYLHNGLEAAMKFFNQSLQAFKDQHLGLDFFDERRLYYFDPKSQLQERLNKLKKISPDYRSIEISLGQFRVELWVQDELISVKTGQSKKVLEKELAKEYLEKLDNIILH